MVSLNHSRYSLHKSLNWLRAVQIGFGVLTIVTAIFALAFPGSIYISVVWVLALVLFFLGIEEIIVGIFSRRKHRWPTIGPGILILIFAAAIAMSFPVAAAITIIIFIGIAFLINGIARIVEGFSGKHSSISRAFLIGVGSCGRSYLCSTVDIAIILWFDTSGDNNWDRFTYNRSPNGFCESEEDMQKILASDLQYSVSGAIFANELQRK